jgi:hypothetical protein
VPAAAAAGPGGVEAEHAGVGGEAHALAVPSAGTEEKPERRTEKAGGERVPPGGRGGAGVGVMAGGGGGSAG